MLMPFRLLNRLPAAVVLASALAAPAAFADDVLIDMTVVGEGTNFKLKFLNSACDDKNAEAGCIEAKRGKSPMLLWELDSTGEIYWMLTRLQFSPDGQNWGDPNFPLADCTMNAFGLEDRDRYTGNASSAMVTGNGRKIMIRNRNEDECRTHYRIYAMPKVGGAEINSDPVIDNRGGGNP